MKQLFLLIGLSICYLTSSAFADCKISAMPDRPFIPTGDIATFQEMATARSNVVAFIDQAKLHLGCISSTRKYNYAVGQIYKMANDYNSQLRAFHSKNVSS